MNVTMSYAFLMILLLLVSLVTPLLASTLSAMQVIHNRTKAHVGDSITWTVPPESISGEVTYAFARYRDSVLIGVIKTGTTPSSSI